MKKQQTSQASDETPCPASLTLDEFIFEQLKSLEDFESSWRELHRKNNEIYPMEMFAGDWSEQLEFWREREDLIPQNAKTEGPPTGTPTPPPAIIG